MIQKLREEMVQLSTKILAAKDDKDLTGLYDHAKNLYEKLAVLKCIDEKLSDVEVDVSKNIIASRFEKLANAVLNGNTAVPESNPHEEDIMTPGMETIKDMVSEMPSEAAWKQVFTEFVEKTGPTKNNASQNRTASLDSPFTKEFQIDLNDKLAFVQHLFNNDMEDYNRVVSQLSTIDTEERSLAFINSMIKPEYNHWKGKEDYEARFIAVIQRRFS